MDRGDPMSLSGSASYYMQQRGMSGSGPQHELQVSPNFRSLSNPNLQFQSSIGGSAGSGSIGSTLPLESSAISSHGINVGAPPGAPPGEPVKRKRGRPRKYGSDGTVLALTPTSSSHPATLTPSQKRGRGRPPGTGKKQRLESLGGLMSGTAGLGFTPHVINIATGEDISAKIMAFAQQCSRAVFMLSANGSVSTVTLRQPSVSGDSVTVRYEGRFEILCLSGSFLMPNSGGSHNRTGGLSISLASPDGRVIGGGVAGVLIASSPVQVMVGSFMWGGSRTKNKKKETSEGQEVTLEPDHQSVHNPSALSGISPSQHLAPASSLSPWPASRPLDMRSSHVDIDLMRG